MGSLVLFGQASIFDRGAMYFPDPDPTYLPDFDLVEESTPRMYPQEVERPSNQYVQVQGDVKPCYICGRNCDCILTFPGWPAARNKPEKPGFQVHTCQVCVKAWKLWDPLQG